MNNTMQNEKAAQRPTEHRQSDYCKNTPFFKSYAMILDADQAKKEAMNYSLKKEMARVSVGWFKDAAARKNWLNVIDGGGLSEAEMEKELKRSGGNRKQRRRHLQNGRK
jgi:hypothetical protein